MELFDVSKELVLLLHPNFYEFLVLHLSIFYGQTLLFMHVFD